MREIFSTRTGPQASRPDSLAAGDAGAIAIGSGAAAIGPMRSHGSSEPATAVKPAAKQPGRSRLEIFRSDPPVFSAAGDRSQIDALFPRQAAYRRAGGNGSGAVEHGRGCGTTASRFAPPAALAVLAFALSGAAAGGTAAAAGPRPLPLRVRPPARPFRRWQW